MERRQGAGAPALRVSHKPPAEHSFLVRFAVEDPVMAQNFLTCDRDQSLLLPPIYATGWTKTISPGS